MPRFIRFIAIISMICIFVSCTKKDTLQLNSTDCKISSQQELDSILRLTVGGEGGLNRNKAVWGYYTRTGRFDQVISCARPYLRKFQESEDARDILYPACYMAQSYVFTDKYDSAQVYINLAEKHLPHLKDEDNFIEGMFYNLNAIYAMKTQMDYTAALEYLKKSLNVTTRDKDTVNQAIILSNIASLYHMREDPAGLPYAEMAYRLGETSSNPNSKILNTTYLAAMYYFTGNYIDAQKYIQKAISMQKGMSGYYGNKSLTYMTYGDIMAGLGNAENAKKAYDAAAEYLIYTSESTAIKLYLSYGNLLYSEGRYKEAEKKYQKGFQIAETTNNVEFTHKILLGLSHLYDQLGDREKALEYHKKYHDTYSKVFNLRKEQEFNSLIMKEQQVKHDEELHEKELAYARMQTKIVIFSAIFLVVFIFSIYSYILYCRKKKMYSTLVTQYNNFTQRINEMSAAEKDRNEKLNKTSKKLYDALEKLMKDDKLYRRKDISLNSVSEMLESNSTYVSKAINTCAGTTFLNYVNSYRMNEVVSILSDPDNDEPLKAIADNAGYGNITSFYRYFQKETGCSPSKFREEMKRIKSTSK